MKRPWFPFYVGDYLRDTARLTAQGHGAYLLLILDYWTSGPPPDDDDVLATIAKLDIKAWKKQRKLLVGFFEVRDGLWRHKRIDMEIAKASAVGTANSDKAREAALRRWELERERKRLEETGQCPDDAPSIDGAMLQNAQPQPPSPSNPDSKKGESNSPPKNFGVIEGRSVPIDDSYEPSDRAIEYAYSLGMKKADLTSELSKFKAMSMATKAVSFNPDMSFKVWCDRWLDHKRKNNPDWAPAPEIPAKPAEPYEVVVENTPEAAAWAMYNREKGLRPLFFCKQLLPSGAIAIGARCKTLFPPGYDEATGEKLQPKGDEAAA